MMVLFLYSRYRGIVDLSLFMQQLLLSNMKSYILNNKIDSKETKHIAKLSAAEGADLNGELGDLDLYHLPKPL